VVSVIVFISLSPVRGRGEERGLRAMGATPSPNLSPSQGRGGRGPQEVEVDAFVGLRTVRWKRPV
jgi:hypothetical protein